MNTYTEINPRYDRIFLTPYYDWNSTFTHEEIKSESFEYFPHSLVFSHEENDFIHWVNNTLINNDPWIAEN